MNGLDGDSRREIRAIAMLGGREVPGRLMRRLVKKCMMENFGKNESNVRFANVKRSRRCRRWSVGRSDYTH